MKIFNWMKFLGDAFEELEGEICLNLWNSALENRHLNCWAQRKKKTKRNAGKQKLFFGQNSFAWFLHWLLESWLPHAIKYRTGRSSTSTSEPAVRFIFSQTIKSIALHFLLCTKMQAFCMGPISTGRSVPRSYTSAPSAWPIN